jgi:SAM-dependent methyltransferase
MGFNDLHRVWEGWARTDPMWAILTDPSKAHGRWDPAEFFSTGELEISALMSDLERKGIKPGRGRCLDFGCGIGRLTQALTQHFDECLGVDISETMILKASKLNRHPKRCLYFVNSAPNLTMFPDNHFNMIYSNIVLQHIEPDLSEHYISEFVRVLSDEGIAVFQVPSAYAEPPRLALSEGAHRASISLDGPLPALDPGRRVLVRVRVRNESHNNWMAGLDMNVGNHWRHRKGRKTLILDDGRGRVVGPVKPGEDTAVELVMRAPAKPGRYILEFDLVEEGVCWFADRGSPTLAMEVVVPRTVRRKIALRSGHATSHHLPSEPPEGFMMYALPRTRVISVVDRSGGRMVDVEDYNPAGEGWESYRYYVTK